MRGEDRDVSAELAKAGTVQSTSREVIDDVEDEETWERTVPRKLRLS